MTFTSCFSGHCRASSISCTILFLILPVARARPFSFITTLPRTIQTVEGVDVDTKKRVMPCCFAGVRRACIPAARADPRITSHADWPCRMVVRACGSAARSVACRFRCMGAPSQLEGHSRVVVGPQNLDEGHVVMFGLTEARKPIFWPWAGPENL
ncbi:hypothetical protein ACLOJK_012533 [Asimina triloba]